MMRTRRRLLFLLAAVLGAAIVVLPAVAGSETAPTIEAVNSSGYYGEQHHYWSPSAATVGAGDAVTLTNPTGVAHGVEWVNGPATPACSSGVPVGTSAAASGTKWSGTCTFAQAGTYTFYCTVHHAEMTGTITVNANGTTTTTTTATTSQPYSSGTTTAGTPTIPPESERTSGQGSSPGSPLAGSASRALKLAPHQHGKSVRGSIQLSQAGAAGRLQVELLARSASLASAGHPAQVRVGRIVRVASRAGRLSFSVPLSMRAKSALSRHGRIALTVKVVVKPSSGAAVTITRSVVVSS
jgi:plastocyanin/uncharacterized protein YfiM (DUF2279 family)